MPTTILRPHLLTLKNRFIFRRKFQTAANREALLLAITSIITVSIYLAFRMAFSAMKSDPLFLMLVPTKIIELTFYYFFILLLVSNTVAAMGNIYSADNMNLLLVAPISSFRLYTAKFLETAIETSLMFFVFTTPAAIAFVTALDLPWKFLFDAFLLSLFFLLIPVGLGVALATFAARIIAGIWRRGTVFVFALLAAAAYAIHTLGESLNRARGRHGGAALAELIDLYQNPNPLWTPSRWVADVLAVYFDGPPFGVWERTLLLIVAAAASFAFGFLVFDLLALRVRSASSVQHRPAASAEQNRRSADVVRKIVEGMYGILPLDPQTRAIIVKDLSSLVRDRALSLQLLLYLGIGTVYVTIFNFMRDSFALAPTGIRLWLATLGSIHFLFTGFIITTVMTRLVYPSMSLEGRSVWILQVTPVEVRRLIQAKFICWLPLTVTMTVLLGIGGANAIGLDWPSTLCMAVTTTFLAVGYTGLAIGLGSMFATFDWESPSQISVGTGALALLLAGVSFVFLFGIPSTVLTFLAVVPRLRELMGPILAAFTMGGALFAIIFGNLLVARLTCDRGARVLAARTGQIV